MIAGVGLDVVTVEEFAGPDSRLRPSEEGYCAERADAASCRGARVAAKCALFRAMGVSAGDDAPWTDVEITRAESGRPSFRIEGRAQTLFEGRGLARLHLTMTHTHDHAAAAVVAET